MITGPQRLVFVDCGHSVTVGNSTFSIGYVVESKISMTGSAIQTVNTIIVLIHSAPNSVIFFMDKSITL